MDKINEFISGPSLDEINSLVMESINEMNQKNQCNGSRNLNIFLKTSASCITKKGDDETNIIDQGSRITYNFNYEHLQTLFKHLENCRLENSIMHFSERQGSTHSKSGMMLDYDIITSNKNPILTDRHYNRIAIAIIMSLYKDINFSEQYGKYFKSVEAKLHIIFIIKKEALLIAETSNYKYGIHILIPGIKLSRSYKKWFIKQFKNDPSVISILQELDAIGDLSECLDQNSASVPVLFFGSCKRGNIPYILGSALEAIIDLTQLDNIGWFPTPSINKIERLGEYNLVAEFSLLIDAEYKNKEPLIKKYDFEVKTEINLRIQDWAERSAGSMISDGELINTENIILTLVEQDSDAHRIYSLLNILGPEYYTERNKWRNVVFAIANTNENYKPLAIWFSQKCPKKWVEGGLMALESLWDEAISKKGSTENPLSIRSITYWAKTYNKLKFQEVTRNSHFTMLLKYTYEHNGKLQHYNIAKILYAMVGSHFCVDIDAGSRGGQTYCWFEFVTPGKSMKDGEIWKWRKETEPDGLHIYMSEKFILLIDQVLNYIDYKKNEADNEEKTKYYKNLNKSLNSFKSSMHNDSFKNGIIKQANYLFRRRGFSEQLDNLPFLFGVFNGVLKLGHKCKLINHFHEYPITRFTTVAFNKFDPYNPNIWHKLVLNAIADIIVEPDARDWILYHAAQGLSGEPKEGIMLLWIGGGQNGKTAFLRWVAKALGPYADKFNIQLMCSEREDADRPNSAIMKFKYLNYAYSEESNKAQFLNVARMKELVNPGELSGRDLNSKQQTFTMKANIVAASQYSLNINTKDHGTWRRIKRYTSKVKFRKNPDPDNPLEKKEDQRFVRQYPSDPHFQSAFLSILVHYYERLQNEYNGELKNVKSSTIERESEEFRIEQDSIHRWISECVLISPNNSEDYTLGMVGGHYIEWYLLNIENKRVPINDIIKDIESSAISKFLRPSLNKMILKGCRILKKGEIGIYSDEMFLVDEDKKSDIKHNIISNSEWWLPNFKEIRLERKKLDMVDVLDEQSIILSETFHKKDNNEINDDDIDRLLGI